MTRFLGLPQPPACQPSIHMEQEPTVAPRQEVRALQITSVIVSQFTTQGTLQVDICLELLSVGMPRGKNPTIFEKMLSSSGACALFGTVTCSSTHCDGLQSSGTACDSMAWRSHEDSSVTNVVKNLITWNSWSACPSTSTIRKCSTCPLSGKYCPHPTNEFTRTLFLDFLSSKTAKKVFILITQLQVFHYNSTKILPQDWMVERLWRWRVINIVLSYSRHWEVPFQVPRWGFILANGSSDQTMPPLLSPAVGIGYPWFIWGTGGWTWIMVIAPAFTLRSTLFWETCTLTPICFHSQEWYVRVPLAHIFTRVCYLFS